MKGRCRRLLGTWLSFVAIGVCAPEQIFTLNTTIYSAYKYSLCHIKYD